MWLRKLGLWVDPKWEFYKLWGTGTHSRGPFPGWLAGRTPPKGVRVSSRGTRGIWQVRAKGAQMVSTRSPSALADCTPDCIPRLLYPRMYPPGSSPGSFGVLPTVLSFREPALDSHPDLPLCLPKIFLGLPLDISTRPGIRARGTLGITWSLGEGEARQGEGPPGAQSPLQ